MPENDPYPGRAPRAADPGRASDPVVDPGPETDAHTHTHTHTDADADADVDTDTRSDPGLVIDPDVDLRDPAERREFDPPHRATLLATIALGGVVGAEARWLLGLAWPHRADEFPWSTLVINVSGCLLMGVLMVLITERWRAHPLVRPLLGVGLLGGYTTMSTYAVETVQAVQAGRVGIALGYLVATPVLAVLAAAVGARLTRAATRTAVRTAS